MGTLVCCFSEKLDRFVPCSKMKLTRDGQRKLLMTPFRYCLGGEYIYAPLEGEGIDERARLCWARVKSHIDLDQLNADYHAGNVPTSTDYYAWVNSLGCVMVSTGNDYLKRTRETKDGFVNVDSFIAGSLLKVLNNNPEALPDVSKDNFESLCAELFYRQGFEVDLFRSNKDGGIDFLAVKNDRDVPTILAVQCKHPDVRPGKERRSLGRPVVQQIYGAAKAHDLSGAVAISSSTYSREARAFAELKPDELTVFDGQDVLNWIATYRWNEDE